MEKWEKRGKLVLQIGIGEKFDQLEEKAGDK